MEIEKVDGKKLKEMETSLFGERKLPVAEFSTGKRLDVVASQKAGKRIEHSIPYITLRYREVRDAVSKPATQAQIKQYPEAFAKYQEDIKHGRQDAYEGWEGLGSPHARQSHRSVEVLRPNRERISGDCRTYDDLGSFDRTG